MKMTLTEYTNSLNKLLKQRPDLGEMAVITSSDDEGNDFGPVYFEPCAGWFEDRDFTREQMISPETEEMLRVNAVCVN
jgi:hypothetical protein